MPVELHDVDFQRLDNDVLASWNGAEAAAVSDCMNRAQAMDGCIQPLNRSLRLVGHARTVRCMVGDNSALHAAINIVEPGDVLVVDAGGFLGNALWGGLMTEAGTRKGIAGLVIDGAVRDCTEIIDSEFPCWCRGTVPAGPHKNFGGEIDGSVACGGVAVRPGDLIVADGDGVAVVPLTRASEVLQAYRALKNKEAQALAALDKGGTLADIYGVPDVTLV